MFPGIEYCKLTHFEREYKIQFVGSNGVNHLSTFIAAVNFRYVKDFSL